MLVKEEIRKMKTSEQRDKAERESRVREIYTFDEWNALSEAQQNAILEGA